MRFVKIALLALICAAPANAADKKAEKNWKSKCASCHGKDGKGHTDQGKKMGVSDLTTAAYKKSKTDAQIDALVKYVRALK